VGKFQSTNQRAAPDRTRHVWSQQKDGSWLCVLCGGVTRQPSDEELPDRFQEVTPNMRKLCPPERGRKL